jgi:hypothetical protein
VITLSDGQLQQQINPIEDKLEFNICIILGTVEKSSILEPYMTIFLIVCPLFWNCSVCPACNLIRLSAFKLAAKKIELNAMLLKYFGIVLYVHNFGTVVY